jgi:hypothetical protein
MVDKIIFSILLLIVAVQSKNTEEYRSAMGEAYSLTKIDLPCVPTNALTYDCHKANVSELYRHADLPTEFPLKTVDGRNWEVVVNEQMRLEGTLQ